MSTSVSGEVLGVWMPIIIFSYLGFEHSVVDMFLFPIGLVLGRQVHRDRLPPLERDPRRGGATLRAG